MENKKLHVFLSSRKHTEPCRFQEKLQHQMVVFTIVLITCSIILYAASLLYYVHTSSRNKLSEAQQQLYAYLDDVYSFYANDLDKARDNANYIRYLRADKEKQASMQSTLYQMNYALQNKAPVKSYLVLSDASNQIVFHTFSDTPLSNQFLAFHNIINEKVRIEQSLQIGVISLLRGGNYFMMSEAVYAQGQVIGYASYYLDGDDFSYHISSQQFDGVIYDTYQNVIATSDNSFIHSSFHQCLDEYLQPTFVKDGTKYLAQIVPYGKQGIQMMACVRAEDGKSLLVLGTSLIVCTGFLLIMASIGYSRKLSQRMSCSVSLLCDEIETIKQGDLSHTIVMKSNDEFETIAENINEMVVTIQDLTKHNTELAYVSKLSELKQLEAQFNPHFLYNTLETIRYSILMQDGIASDMIIKFTKILRYSINNAIETADLKQDLQYTRAFLQLQTYRFRDRLTYTIDVDEACMDAIVPKLMLQPLLENSIKNGFQHKTSLNICIRGYRVEDTLILQVEDDGIGFTKEELTALHDRLQKDYNGSDHHGLFNTHRRLYLMYGEGSGITVESIYKEKTVVTIRLVLGGDYVQNTDC